MTFHTTLFHLFPLTDRLPITDIDKNSLTVRKTDRNNTDVTSGHFRLRPNSTAHNDPSPDMMFLSQVVALLVFATSVSVSASALDEQHLRRSRLRADRHATLATRQSTSFTYVGCVTDNTARLLTGSYTKDNSLTPAKCFTYCANYQYAAMESALIFSSLLHLVFCGQA